MKQLITLTFAVIIFTALPAHASKMIAAPGQNCDMVENVQLGVNFNNIPVELGDIRALMDQKIEEIEEISKELGLGELHIQNMNYNVYSNNNSCGGSAASDYRLNGNISFKMPDSQSAADLMEKLKEKDYNINFNMNAYRQCR